MQAQKTQLQFRSANPEGLEGEGHQSEEDMPRAQALFPITGRRSQEESFRMSCSLHAVFVSRLGCGTASRRTAERLQVGRLQRGVHQEHGGYRGFLVGQW